MRVNSQQFQSMIHHLQTQLHFLQYLMIYYLFVDFIPFQNLIFISKNQIIFVFADIFHLKIIPEFLKFLQ